jgi:hypothetical protein
VPDEWSSISSSNKGTSLTRIIIDRIAVDMRELPFPYDAHERQQEFFQRGRADKRTIPLFVLIFLGNL